DVGGVRLIELRTRFALQHKTPDNVAAGSKADICSGKQYVRFTPESGHLILIASRFPCASYDRTARCRTWRWAIRPLCAARGEDPCRTRHIMPPTRHRPRSSPLAISKYRLANRHAVQLRRPPYKGRTYVKP